MAAAPSATVDVTLESVRRQLTELLNAIKTEEVPPRSPSEEQVETVHLLLTGHDVRYVDRTGAGKTETYFSAIKLLRRADSKAGPAIVITPLNALMDDQVKRAAGAKLMARRINSDTSQMERDTIIKSIQRNQVDLLFLTPEMIHYANSHTNNHVIHRVQQFKKAYKPTAPTSNHLTWAYVPLVVIDEIHYISEVGYTFRKQYKLIWADLQGYSWFKGARKLGLTATFNTRVRLHIIDCLPGFAGWSTVEGQVFRSNLSIRVISSIPNTPAREKWIVDYVTKVSPTHNVLIFAQTIKDCERYLELFEQRGVEGVAIHHAQLSAEERKQTESDFRGGQVRVLINTKTLSLGFDKKDIHDVIHLYTPPSTVQYCQEIGRAGRDPTIKACAWLLTTQPWNSDGWYNALTTVARHLSGIHDHTDSKSNVEAMLAGQTMYSAKMQAEALDVGVTHEVLTETDGNISLNQSWRNKLDSMKSFVEGQKVEMEAMTKLNTNKQCCWNVLLKLFEQQLPDDAKQCGNCSYPACAKSNEEYIDNTQVDACAGDAVFYSTVTPAGFKVYGLAITADRVVDLDLVRIQRVLSVHVPGVYLSPPSCSIAYVPGRSQDNAANMRYMAEQLNLHLMQEYAKIQKGFARSSREEKTEEAKQELVKEKYEIDKRAIPKAYAGQQVILYDDVICSGSTFDRLAEPLKDMGYNVIGLVGKIWKWKDRAVTTFTIADTDGEDAEMELSEQQDEEDEKAAHGKSEKK